MTFKGWFWVQPLILALPYLAVSFALFCVVMEFNKFLESVDSPAKDSDYIEAVVAIFASCDIWDHKDLIADRDTQIQMFSIVTKNVQSAGKIAFIKRAFEHAGILSPSAPAQDLQLAPNSLLQVLRKEEKKVIHVDMPTELKEVALDSLLPCSLPKGTQVDALATEIDRLKQKGIVAPFVNVDLRKFLPSWMDELSQAGESSDEEDSSRAVLELAKALGAKTKVKRNLTMLQWGIAFDKYAFAASATRQITFAATVAHKDICLQVAARAQLKHRRHFLGVLYDEVCRKEWSELAYGGSSKFNVSEAATKLCDTLLTRAENLYDQQFAKGSGKSNGKGKRNSWGTSSWNSYQPASKRARY